MPRSRVKKRTAVDTLQENCIANICKHMDTVWCKEFLQKYNNHAHMRYILGPFDAIFPELREKIMRKLKEMKQLKKHHIYLLISVYSKSIDFSRCDSDIALGLQLTEERCYMLQKLNISHCRKLPKQGLHNLLCSSKNLVELDVSHSNVDNNTVLQIFQLCPQLKSLDISHTSVGDKAFAFLRSENGNVNDIQIVVLKMLSSAVTSQGVEHAILYLPHLKVLEHDESVSGLAQVLEYHDKCNLNITTLHSEEQLTEESELCKVLLAACKTLQNLHLTTNNVMLTEATTFALLEAEKLQKLCINNQYQPMDSDLSFQQIFAPILMRYGAQLTVLELSNMTEICIPLIKNVCTQLSTLSLTWNISYLYLNRTSNHPSRPYFESLKNVTLFSNEVVAAHEQEIQVANILHEDLTSILRSPLLEKINLNNQILLTDAIFENCVTYTRFAHVKEFSLQECNNVTFDAIRCVLEAENPLESVRLIDCKSITRRDTIQYQTLANKNNWFVSLEWR